MKKAKNKKFLIILLVVVLLGLAVGYAAFSDTLRITGTATAGGTFDMEFLQSGTSISDAQGINATESSATVSSDKNTLTVTIKDLSYPGAGAKVNTVIHNAGSIPAKVKSVTTNLPSGNAIKVNGLDAITTSHPVIAADGTCNLSFTVVWDESVNELSDAEKSGVTFDLTVEYEQATTTFDGSPSHAD